MKSNQLLAESILFNLGYDETSAKSAAKIVERVLYENCVDKLPAVPKPTEDELAALDWVQQCGGNHGVALTKLLQRAGIIKPPSAEEKLAAITSVVNDLTTTPSVKAEAVRRILQS
jgi:hypothetical protein